MTKYYRVCSQEQWEWLKNKLEIEDDLHVSNFPVTILYGDVICGIYRYHDDPEPLIEISQMMEDEKMANEDYVVIRDDDLLKLKDENNDLIFMIHKDGSFDGVEGLRVPKSLLYPKVKMTQAEKDEFDILQEDESVRTLSDVFCKLDELNYNGFPHLSEWFLLNPIKQTQAQIEFARAWADPSLIEVIPEKRWNVKVAPFERTKRYYCKGDKGLLGEGDSCNNQYEFQQFTTDELKEYGLDDNMFEKVEVTDDGTK